MIIEDIPGFLRDEKPHDAYRRMAQEVEDRRANEDWKRHLEAQHKRDEAVAEHIGSLEWANTKRDTRSTSTPNQSAPMSLTRTKSA